MKAPKNFAIWSFSSSKSSSSISSSSRTKKRRKRYTKYTEEKEAEDENGQKNTDFLSFLALFQGKEICFVLCGKQFLIRPLPFGLISCMTQQNKGVSIFLPHKKKQSSLPWNKVKAPKKFAIWFFSSSKSSSSISGSSRTKKKKKKIHKIHGRKRSRGRKLTKKMRKFFTSFWFLTQFNSYISIYTL